jgi:hypothetical protein
MNISPRILLSLALAAYGLRAGAAAPPPEKLLPKDTLLVITAPDWGKARLFWTNQPYARFWQDPGLKAFKDKFMDKFSTGVIKPLEQSLGIKFSDYEGLAQGQATFALVPVIPKNNADAPVAAVLVMDAKDHAAQLKANLAQVIKKWADAGKPMKSQKIRETDFTTFFVSPDDLSWKKLFPGVKPAEPSDTDAATPPATNKIEITVGQSDSLLLVSSSTEVIEKILSRQAGGMVPPLEESPSFQADYGPRLRESPFYLWLNAKILTDALTKLGGAAGDDTTASSSNLSTIISATGLANLSSLSLSYKHYPDGDGTQLFLAVPEDKRPALLKIFTAEAKDSAPPSFVPADAVKYWRWRLNMARSWKNLEAMLNDLIPPQVMAQINMVFAMAGKDKDEHYDLKSELLNNLGDDIISYTKAAKSSSLQDIKSPPTLFLLGSPNPDKLAAALKVLLAIPFQGAPVTDREFLGRKIYNVAPPTPAGAAKSAGVSFCASGGYLAIAGDASVLEEYLRSSDSKGKALMDMQGLVDAAQKVGGMETGLFGFQNESQTMRPLFEVLRKQNPSVQDILGVPIPDMTLAAQLESFRQWVDFSLLPPFDTVAKYFSFSVYAGSFSSDGFALKMYMPTPPQLRQ